MAASLLVALLFGGSAVQGATFIIINEDSGGVGFTDPAPRAPVGGNSGTTLGQQRLNAFQFTADIWGAILHSTVPIRVGSTFSPQPPLPCEHFSTQLGQAGPSLVHKNFPGAPLANTWYPQALANSIAGTNLSGDADGSDINAEFNDLIDTGCFAGAPNGWYYGLDGNPPAGQLDLIPVLLHEFCHGLGFLSFMDVQTGALLGASNQQALIDVFSTFLKDHTTGVLFPNMISDAQRLAAITNPGNLHWVGPDVAAHSAFLSAGRVDNDVLMYAPPTPASGASVSHFDISLTPDELMEPYATEHSQRVLATQLLRDIGWSLNDGSTPIPTPTPLAPTPTPPPCAGDCAGGGAVTVDEILTLVNIALGNLAAELCRAGDVSGDGLITVDEILAAVNNVLNGCG